MMKQKCLWILTIFLAAFLAGCASGSKEPEKIRDLEFTVVCEDKLPKELLQMINERKSERFEIAFSDAGYTYFCRGFGMQQTGGYSSKVNAVYQTDGGVVLDTEFIGPDKSENVPQSPSYPYIVIKTEEVELKKRAEKGAPVK